MVMRSAVAGSLPCEITSSEFVNVFNVVFVVDN